MSVGRPTSAKRQLEDGLPLFLQMVQSTYIRTCIPRSRILLLQAWSIQELIVDTSFVKNVWGRDCLGKSPVDRGRKATKVSILTDARGTPLQLLFHPGNKNDSRSLPHLLDTASKRVSLSGKHIYADKIYDSTYCSDTIRRHQLVNRVSKKRTTPSKANNRIRIVVEHAFSWLDKFRRIILRYDGLVCHFRSFHCLAACHLIGLRLSV